MLLARLPCISEPLRLVGQGCSGRLGSHAPHARSAGRLCPAPARTRQQPAAGSLVTSWQARQATACGVRRCARTQLWATRCCGASQVTPLLPPGRPRRAHAASPGSFPCPRGLSACMAGQRCRPRTSRLPAWLVSARAWLDCLWSSHNLSPGVAGSPSLSSPAARTAEGTCLQAGRRSA